MPYRGLIGRYVYNRGKKVPLQDGEHKVFSYKEHPGGVLVYTPKMDGIEYVYIIDRNEDGSLGTSHRNEMADWYSKSGKDIIQVFNNQFNTSMYGWYPFRDIIDLSNVKFDNYSAISQVRTTDSKVELRSYLDNNRWICIEVNLDGKPLDLTKYGESYKDLYVGIRKVVDPSTSSAWLSSLLRVLTQLGIDVNYSSGDDVSNDTDTELGIDEPIFIMKSAYRLVREELGLQSKDDGRNKYTITQSSNPLFKIEMNKDTGEFTYRGNKSVVVPGDDPNELSKSIRKIVNYSGKIRDIGRDLKFHYLVLEDLADELSNDKLVTDVSTPEDKTDVVELIHGISKSIRNAYLRTGNHRPGSTRLREFYSGLTEYLRDVVKAVPGGKISAYKASNDRQRSALQDIRKYIATEIKYLLDGKGDYSYGKLIDD